MTRAPELLFIVAVALAGTARAEAPGTALKDEHFRKAPDTPAVPRPPEPPPVRPPVTSIEAPFAVLKALDKVTGEVATLVIPVGESGDWARLTLRVRACRMPGPGEPEDAYIWIEIEDRRPGAPGFRGWMFASSPAVSALDHPRYDVWAISCRTSAADASDASARN